MKECTSCGETKELTDFYSQVKKPKKKAEYVYYYPECKECTKVRSTKWGEDNRERKREQWKKHSALPHKRELQKKLMKEARDDGRFREWQRSNPDKMKEYRLSRANKQHDISIEEWIACKDYFDNECAYCGLHISEHFNKYAGEMKRTDFHKEHVEHDGANDITNCVPACKKCNTSKHTASLEAWYTTDHPNYTEERLNKIYTWLYQDVYNEDIV